MTLKWIYHNTCTCAHAHTHTFSSARIGSMLHITWIYLHLCVGERLYWDGDQVKQWRDECNLHAILLVSTRWTRRSKWTFWQPFLDSLLVTSVNLQLGMSGDGCDDCVHQWWTFRIMYSAIFCKTRASFNKMLFASMKKWRFLYLFAVLTSYCWILVRVFIVLIYGALKMLCGKWK